MPNHNVGETQEPRLRHLQSDHARSRLVQIRHAVAPILANNILHHFTDHSVSHSDSVCALVDALIDNLQATDARLSEEELMVLYSACYLHDIGMQFEAAGTTQVIRGLQLTLAWEELAEQERRIYFATIITRFPPNL